MSSTGTSGSCAPSPRRDWKTIGPDDLFQKLLHAGVLAPPLAETLRRMKGLRNLLVHEYGRVDDEIVFETVRERLGDFDASKREILVFLRPDDRGVDAR